MDNNIIEQALKLMGNTMKYKILEDGSYYFYTEEYELKNQDTPLHSIEPRKNV
jgi:hypothetical protein